MLMPAENSADPSTEDASKDLSENVKEVFDADEVSTAGEPVASVADPGAFTDEPDLPLTLEIHIDFLEEVPDCSGDWCDEIIG